MSSIVDADGSKLAPDSASPFITAVRRPGKRSQREEKNPFAGNFASLGIEARWSSPRLHALVRVLQSDQHLCAGIQKDEESDTAISLLKNRAHRLEHGVLEGVRPPSNNRATLNTVTADTSYISTVSDHNC